MKKYVSAMDKEIYRTQRSVIWMRIDKDRQEKTRRVTNSRSVWLDFRLKILRQTNSRVYAVESSRTTILGSFEWIIV